MKTVIQHGNKSIDNAAGLYTLGCITEEAKDFAVVVLDTPDVCVVSVDYKVKDMLQYDANMVKIASFSDVFPHMRVDVNEQKDRFDVVDNLSNSVMFNEKRKVLYIPFMLWSDVIYSDTKYFLFGTSQESIDEYVKSLQDIRRDGLRDKIVTMTDTQYDVIISTQSKDTTVTTSDVMLEESIKVELLHSIESFFADNGEIYKRFNIPYKRGVLLYGTPGNGKTTLIKSIVNMVNNPVVYWQVNEFTGSSSLSNVFEHAKTMAPCLLIIEDLDSLPNSMRSMFLNYLDGTYNNDGIFIIGTTNYPDRIDPALMNRAGRFDRAYEVKPPNAEMRYKYLLHKGIGRILTDDAIQYAAEKLVGFSMATLNEVYTSAVLQYCHNDGVVDIDGIIDSLKETGDKQRTDNWYTGKRKVGF